MIHLGAASCSGACFVKSVRGKRRRNYNTPNSGSARHLKGYALLDTQGIHAGDDPTASPLQRHPRYPGEGVPCAFPDHQAAGDRTSPYHRRLVSRRRPLGSTRAPPCARATPGRGRITPRPRRKPYAVVALRLLLGDAEAAVKARKAAMAGCATAGSARATGRARARVSFVFKLYRTGRAHGIAG